MMPDTPNSSSCTIMREVILGDNLERFLKHLPKFNSLVVCRQQEVRSILPFTPFDFVDLFFDFEGF